MFQISSEEESSNGDVPRNPLGWPSANVEEEGFEYGTVCAVRKVTERRRDARRIVRNAGDAGRGSGR